MYVNVAKGVNLREGPSTDAAILTGVPYGMAVSAVGVSGEWREVYYGSLRGYILGQYLSSAPVAALPDEGDYAEPNTDGPTVVYDPSLVEVPGWHAVIAASSLNVRDWCAEDAPVRFTLMQGAQVDLLQVGDAWCHIQYNEVDGYCKTMYLTLLPLMP